MRPIVYLLTGLPGSGKSTYAKALERTGVVRLSVDDLITARHGRLEKDYPASMHLELLGPVLDDARSQLVEHVRAGRSVVFDHGLGTRAVRDEFKSFVVEHGARWKLVYFPVEQAELLRRLAIRNEDPEFGVLSPEVLAWMAQASEHPDGEGEELP